MFLLFDLLYGLNRLREIWKNLGRGTGYLTVIVEGLEQSQNKLIDSTQVNLGSASALSATTY